MIKVFLAEDHSFIIQGIKHFLEHNSDISMQVVGVAKNIDDVIIGIAKTKPELLFLDLNMNLKSCTSILPDIRKKFPKLRIIIYTAYDDPRLVKEALRGGADGYILKTSSPDELMKGVKVVLQGKIYTGSGVRIVSTSGDGIIQQEDEDLQRMTDDFQQLYNLTIREVEILKLIASGMSNKEIATELYISDQTVSVHRKNIMRKLNVNHIAGLVKLAIDYHLI